MSKKDYAADISQQGFPGEVADHIADVIALALDGRNAFVTGDVEKVLGHPARDFADYAHAAAAAGAWNLPVSSSATYLPYHYSRKRDPLMDAKTTLLGASIVATGLMSGLWYGWTVSVIPGTRRIPDTSYVATMQNIN